MLDRELRHLYTTLCLAFAIGVSACAGWQSPPVPQTITQGLVYAQTTATAANTLAADLVLNGTITPERAEDVGATADLVVLAVRKGRTLLALGDAAGARAQLEALAADLAMLAAFLQARQ